MTNPILDTALQLHDAGYSVLPIRADGTKAPAIAWKAYTQQRANIEQVHAWFDEPGYDLAVVQGAVSGGAELTELEGRAVGELATLRALAVDTGLGDLWARIVAGWTETSPSGGFHFHTRLTGAPVPGNTKLAKAEDRLVLAETRGESGYVVVAPSTHHDTGKVWSRLTGGPATAALLTVEEREAFHALIATLDRTPAPTAPERPTGPARVHDGLTPGDDYEAKVDWSDILGPHGWVHVLTRGSTRYWRRPGKSAGFSATTGHADDRDRLYVFTSSTVFEQEVPYTKLGALAVLEYDGDHSAAAKALARDGYGQPATRLAPERPDGGDDLAGLIIPRAQDRPAGPREPQQRNDPPGAPATHKDPLSVPPERPAAAPTVVEERPAEPNQDNTALLLIDRHQHEIRYCPQKGSWLTWNGHRWTWDDNEHVRELARAIARRLPTRDGWEKYTKGALTANGISGTLRLAQSDPRTVVHLTQLDAALYELNTPAGIVDLTTGTLRPADPAALHTRTTTVAPDQRPTPIWDAFLATTFVGDPDLLTYVQRLLGVSLVGDVLEQVLPFAYGSGANGKSVLFKAVQELVGLGEGGYAASIPADMLVARAREDHPAVIAQLAGVRIAIGGELEEGARFAEAKVKALSGGDPINARFMGKNPFTFIPTHSLWLHANHEPEVRAGGTGFWRRLKKLPFIHTVPKDKQVRDLEKTLVREEGPGILQWLITGAADYFTHGLTEPASVTAATDAYQHDTDTVAQFVDDACELGAPNAQHMHVRTAALRTAYETYCRGEGLEPISAKALTQQLRSRYGVVSSRTGSSRSYDGIRLVDVSSDDDDPSPASDRRRPEQQGW